ncbi:hypothetical protein, partial [Rhizobium leguminosarum]|uniref:hypothetical protein n=1 Tax=Rhizobium leguminosarum TaxID=384 RepID=UPI003F9765B0
TVAPPFEQGLPDNCLDLLNLRRNGAESTKAGKALLPFTMEIEERIDNLLRASLDIAAHTQ